MEPVRYPQGRNMSAGYNCNTMNRRAAGCAPCSQQMQPGSGRMSSPTMSCKERFDDNREMFPVGMSYVPWQSWGELYPPEKGLCEGTIFMDLNQIFCGKRGTRA